MNWAIQWQPDGNPLMNRSVDMHQSQKYQCRNEPSWCIRSNKPFSSKQYALKNYFYVPKGLHGQEFDATQKRLGKFPDMAKLPAQTGSEIREKFPQ
ncbi:hypothetical protein ACMYR3_02795 [Ampullimonas aquatilis]|uniref:hypothetical protein n=1 Tax=Ampullimonas aquatilis TaxID=1341549 RepID=UPI003C76E761